MDKILILMATYNGAKYLKEQLDSLLMQTYKNWELLIRDDGSTDNTLEILEEYATHNSNIHYIEGKNVGVNKNYELLLNTAKEHNSNYIMLCDQDDIWLQNKIEITKSIMSDLELKYTKNCPLLAYTSRQYVTEDNRNIDYESGYYTDDLWSLLATNNIFGCTMMFNNILLDKLTPIPDYIKVYDYWIALNAALYGYIKHSEIKTIRYRQHSNNVTSGMRQFSIISKISNFKRDNDVYLTNIKQNYLFCINQNKLQPSKTLQKFMLIIESSPIKRLMLSIKFNYEIGNYFQNLRLYYNLFLYK